MTALPVLRRRQSLFPDFSELFAAFPPTPLHRTLPDARWMRLEDEVIDGRYEVRAEMPGVDPEKDIDVVLQDGQLTIKAERSENREFDGRSEFSYGSFARTVALPTGADESDVKASYDRGILTVSVAVSTSDRAEKHVPVVSVN